jgi:S1-C subfamily serine protease
MVRLLCALALLAGGVAAAAPDNPPPPPPVAEPKFIDDDELYDQFFDKLEELAKAKKPLAHKQLVEKLKPRAAGVAPAAPGGKALSPEEVYKAAAKGVFVLGSIYPHKDGFWEVGTYATAWVLAPDGVLVSNWHVFEDLNDGEVFGACDREGNVYPVTDFLGGDKTADVAVFRIATKGLTPLPVSPAYAEVGSWVGVVSHPGDLFYLYTQGAVTRYSTNKNDDGTREKWMGITAEFASGSSGSPVHNKFGAVVGMSALTMSIDATDDPKKEEPKKPARRAPAKRSRAEPPKAEKKDGKGDKAKPEKPEANKGSPQQMVVKMAVPGPVLLKWVGK